MIVIQLKTIDFLIIIERAFAFRLVSMYKIKFPTIFTDLIIINSKKLFLLTLKLHLFFFNIFVYILFHIIKQLSTFDCSE